MGTDKKDLVYQLDGIPSLRYAIPLGLQHILAMFVGNIAPVLILAAAVGLDDANTRIMVQAVMFTSGVTTLVQVYPIKIGKFQIGTRLPIVMGISFAFVSVSSAVGAEYGIGAVFGGAIVGALLEFFIGAFYKYVKRVFNPLVTGSLLLALGIHLIGVGANYFIGGYGPNRGTAESIIVACITFSIVLGLNVFGKGIFKSSAILIGILIGYFVSIPFGLINFEGISELNFISYQQMIPFSVAKPEFVGSAIVAFTVVYFATAVETIGGTKGICTGALEREATDKEIQGGLLADAAGSIFATAFNGLPNTCFGQNVGIVCSTKIVNRFVVACGGMFLIIVSFFPQVAEFFRLMPDAVLGGALITVFAVIMTNGFSILCSAGASDKNLFILSTSFALGLGLGGNEAFLAIAPGFVRAFFDTTVTSTAIVAMILSIFVKPDFSKGTYVQD